MDPVRKQAIFARISHEFNISTFHRRYYCEKLSYDVLKGRLLAIHPALTEVLFRADHIVVRTSDANDNIFVYLFVSHSSGKCAPIHE